MTAADSLHLTQAPIVEAAMLVHCAPAAAFRAFADPAITTRFWYTKSSGPMELVRAQTLMMTVGDHSAPARITEETPQGTHSIAGVGAPPFPLQSFQLT